VCIAAVAFFVYSYRITQVVHPHLSLYAGPALASALLVGACLGFLPHNSYPAKIFMGDTGSMLLGLLLAYVPISSITSLDYASLHSEVNRFPEFLPLLLPAAILVIPYTDLLLAVTRRVRAGKSPLAPDRRHLHHRLQDMGHPHRTSVLILYLWATLFSAAIVWLSIARTPLFMLGVTTFVAIVALLFMSMPRLRWWQRSHRRARAAAASVAAQSISMPRPQPVRPARPTSAAAMPASMIPAPTMAPPSLPATVPPPPLPQPSLPAADDEQPGHAAAYGGPAQRRTG
jgi:UDP-GlcNAc:undecaprenyl-phosphate/decaprenyl-phosphate GlcNAc-1-phosphate transferase